MKSYARRFYLRFLNSCENKNLFAWAPIRTFCGVISYNLLHLWLLKSVKKCDMA